MLIIIILILFLIYIENVSTQASFLPANQIILKGHNKQYAKCYDLMKSIGVPNNEISNNCSEFTI